MIKVILKATAALTIALIIGAGLALCAVLILGSGASLLVSGPGLLWPRFLDQIIVAVALIVFTGTAIVIFRELKGKFNC